MAFINVPNISQVTVSSSGTGPAYLLDILGAASASFSFRQLSASYLGPSLRVRRSSDDAETDIEFVNGDFDTATYEAFVGGGNGFCTKFYDQSASYDLVQATSANQPQIVQEDGRYVLKFTGGKFLRVASFLGTTASTTTSVIWKCPTAYPTGLNSAQSAIDFSATELLNPWWTGVQGMTYLSTGLGITKYPIVAYEDGQWRLNSFIFSGGNYSGTQFGINATISAATTAPGYSRLTLGKNDFSAGNFFATELVIWPNNSIDKQTLSDQMKTRYPSLYPAPRNLFIVGGDSISTTLYCGLGASWSAVAFPQTTVADWFNVVQGGWTLQNLIDNQEKLIWHNNNIDHTTSYCIIFAGTNDISVDGLTGAQAFARLQTLTSNLKAGGVDNVIVITPLPRGESTSPGSISFEIARQAFSNLCVAAEGSDFLAVVDTRNLVIGVNGEQDSTTYYVNDYVHMNAAGEDVLGDAVATVLNGIL